MHFFPDAQLSTNLHNFSISSFNSAFLLSIDPLQTPTREWIYSQRKQFLQKCPLVLSSFLYKGRLCSLCRRSVFLFYYFFFQKGFVVNEVTTVVSPVKWLKKSANIFSPLTHQNLFTTLFLITRFGCNIV